MYVPFPLHQVELQAPLPVNVWDPEGVLLLRKGEVIRDAAHRDLLESHLPMVEEDEYRQWTYRYTSAIDRMVRNDQRLEDIAGVTRPMGLEPIRADVERSLTERWSDLHAVLGLLLHQGADAQDLLPRLVQIERRLLDLLSTKVDDSLFLLVQMLHDRTLGYSATHALLCAVLCRLVSGTLGLTDAHREALVRAALTMNIGMSRLHDVLAQRAGAPTAQDRALIDGHPRASVDLLRRHGVRDAMWLGLVESHHQPGQPLEELASADPLVLMRQLLALSDGYAARISPRADRKALSPHRAARDACLGANGLPTALGAVFIKTLGVHIPGSHVRLANGEVGVVVRRGRKANAPWVMSLVGRHGMPLGEPALRDTSDPGLGVVGGVAPDEVKVRIHPVKLLARL